MSVLGRDALPKMALKAPDISIPGRRSVHGSDFQFHVTDVLLEATGRQDDKTNLGPELLAQVAVNALMLSSMYMLMALGFALLLSVMRVLNFAHAVIYMGGGYICYQLAAVYGVNQWLSLGLAAIIMGLFGLFLERFCFRPFFGDVDRTIVMTLALIVIMESAVNISVGTQVRSLPAFASGVLKAGGVFLSVERLVTFLISATLLLALFIFIQKTKLGQQMLAVSQDSTGAVLLGINLYRVSAVATVIACALAAVAGGLMGAIISLSPYMGRPHAGKSN